MEAEVKTLADGKVGLVALAGEIDFSVLSEMRTALDQAMVMSTSSLLVDLSSVTFIASDGLGVLIDIQRRAEKNARTFDLVHPQPHILGMLRKTQLTRLFKIFETVDDALATLQ